MKAELEWLASRPVSRRFMLVLQEIGRAKSRLQYNLGEPAEKRFPNFRELAPVSDAEADAVLRHFDVEPTAQNVAALRLQARENALRCAADPRRRSWR